MRNVIPYFHQLVGGIAVQYTVRRSQKRRTIGITIKHGEVKVSAPAHVAAKDIEHFIVSKQDWIQRHLQAQQQRLSALPQRQWQHGETLYWLGQPLELEVREGHRNTIAAIDKKLAIRVARRSQNPAHQVKRLVARWFKEQAEIWLEQCFAERLPAFKDQPNGWRVANYTAKWGACSQRGELSFSWRLFAAPPWVVDYVVVHELCHLRHFNHSAEFWQLVGHHYATYPDAERWLKDHGHTLLNDNIFSYVNGSLTTRQDQH